MTPTLVTAIWTLALGTAATVLARPAGETPQTEIGGWPALAGWWALAVVSIVGSALCSGIEMGSYALNRVRLDLRAAGRHGSGAARSLREEIASPERLVATLLIGNNIFNSLNAAAISGLFARIEMGEVMSVAVNFLVVAPTLFLLGEAVPKEVFRAEADSLTPRFGRVLAGFRWVLTVIGVLPLIIWCARRVERWAGLSSDTSGAGDDPRQRIAALLREGALSGGLSVSQRTLVDRALAMRDIKVEAEMVPWERVRVVRSDWDMDRVRRVAADQPNTRLPIVEKSGRVVGVLRQIDLYIHPASSLAQLAMTAPRLAPETPLPDALRTVLLSTARLGIVERGGRPVGLVTAKDLAEPLTGELPDW